MIEFHKTISYTLKCKVAQNETMRMSIYSYTFKSVKIKSVRVDRHPPYFSLEVEKWIFYLAKTLKSFNHDE